MLNLHIDKHVSYLHTGKRYGAVIYPIKPRFLCSRCFGVADLVSPTIHQSLAPRRFCYTFRITGSAFLTVSFITDYREPYLNQNIQKKHFNSNSSYFSTSCIDLDAGVEVKVCYILFISYKSRKIKLEHDELALRIFATRAFGIYGLIRKIRDSHLFSNAECLLHEQSLTIHTPIKIQQGLTTMTEV